MKTPNTPKEWCELVMRGAMIFALLQPVQNLHAQNPARGIKFERFSREQGLSQSSVFCILQDRQGFMWFGTLDGLNKYDGYNFTVYKHDALDSTSLSDNLVTSIYEDSASRNMLWIGTGGGLNRFDRATERFTHFVNDPKNPHSLSNNSIRSIYEDHAGTLWIGTSGGGLNKFDREKERFIRYVNDPKNPRSLSNNSIWSIYEDHAGTLWIGTRGGLNKFDREKEQFTHFVNDPKNPHSLSHNDISSIYEDHAGTLWIGTRGGGLNKLDREKEQFTRFVNDPKNPHSLSNNHVLSILEDSASRNTLWIGTKGGGLNKLVPSASSGQALSPASSGSEGSDRPDSPVNKNNETAGQFTRFVNDPKNPHSLSDNAVASLYADDSGIFWIGTEVGGLNKFDRDKERFTHFANAPDNPNSLNNNTVMSIYEDSASRNTLWIGTWGGGLNKFDREKEQFTHFVNDPKNPHSLSNNHVLSIHEDFLATAGRNTLWIGTYGGGLNKFVASAGSGQALSPAAGAGEGSDREKAQFTHYVNDPKNPHSLSDNSIWSIYADSASRNTLWIGTYGGGLNKLVLSEGEGSDREKGQFTRFVNDPNNPHSLSNNLVSSIYKDHTGTLWIGTAGGGLNKLVLSPASSGVNFGEGSDQEKEQFTHYVNDPKNPHSLSHNMVFSIYEASLSLRGAGRSTLWIGTAGGLNEFDRETGRFTRYTEKDGLPNNAIIGILEDNNGHLWLSTNKGISRFDPSRPAGKTFRNYDVSDGLQSNEFNASAYHKSKSGEMFFGGINGFNMFHPDSIKDNPYLPPVVMTAFKRYNTDETEGIAIEEKGISEKHEIELSYKDNILSFEFAALSFRRPEKNQYAYKLEGYSDKWIHLGAKRDVTFTNLDPGEYTLRVKGSNNDGVWNEEGTLLKITITPPWWRTRWAYSIYALLVMTGVFATDRVQRRRLLKKERERAEAERKDLELKKAAELKVAYERLTEAHQNLKATQQQLITQEKLASLGQLTAGIAHEIKNPLNFVNNFAVLSVDLMKELNETLARQKDKLGEEVVAEIEDILATLEQNAEKITHHGKRADGIVKSMMQHARGSSGQRELVDINHLLDEAVNLTYHGMRANDASFNVTIEKEYDESIGKLEVVPQDMSRVFLNIVNNACYATQQRKKDKKSEKDEFSPTLSVSTKNLGDKIEIRIRDNGNGIPAEVREKIFNPFFTTKPAGQGTGLGLSISYDIIVQQHRGEIKVETEEGKFTECVISLPREVQRKG